MLHTRDAAKVGSVEYVVTSYDCDGYFDPDAVRWQRKFGSEIAAERSVDAASDTFAKMERMLWVATRFVDDEYGNVSDAEPEYDDEFYREYAQGCWSGLL